MHTELGYDSILLGKNCGPYPYLEKHLSGLNMEFLPNSTVEESVQYVIDHAAQMDLLMI